MAIAPLGIITAVSYNQYKAAFREGLIQPAQRLTSSMKRSIEFFLEERRAAMKFIVRDRSFAELADQQQMTLIFRNMREAFGGIIDLGLIGSAGVQRSYAGPYELRGVNYAHENWFREVRLRDVYVSDVFLGYRAFPHFVIAVRHEDRDGGFYVLRATLDLKILERQIAALDLGPSSDAFLINHNGVLQTSSGSGFHVLESYLRVPDYTEGAKVSEERDEGGNPYILGYAYIESSPFIFVMLKKPDALRQGWGAMRNELLGFLATSIVLILLLVVGTSSYMVA
ncbi:MAG: cache domain-containing protein [Candidatus Zixiibacteriota bacterium]